MNQQKERILSESEIQSLYDGLQVQLKSMMECLKHNKNLMKEFGNATCEYGDKLEEISKRTISDMMKINTNYVLKEMSAKVILSPNQIKQLGSQIMGTSAAVKELCTPISEISKQLKDSYNDQVKQISMRKKEQEEQARKLNEVKSKVSTYQKSVLPIDSHMTPQFRNLKQQEKMLTEEQKMKLLQVNQCKSDLSDLMIEENLIIEERIQKTQVQCYEFVSMCLEKFNDRFNQIAQIKDLIDGSLKMNKSGKRSVTPRNNSRILSDISNQLPRTPKGQMYERKESQQMIQFSRSKSPYQNNITPIKEQHQKTVTSDYIEYEQRRDRTPQQRSQRREQPQYELVESEVYQESGMQNTSRQLNQATIFSKRDKQSMTTLDQTRGVKRSGVSQNSSFYDCSQFVSKKTSVNPQEYI